MNSNIFNKLSPWKLIIRCAIPAMVNMVFVAFYQIADGFFVGRFIGQEALAAVNLIMPVIMISFALSDMVASGASVRISILLGEKNKEKASIVFSSSLKIIFIISIFIGIIGFLFSKELLTLLSPGASVQTIKYGVTYLRIYAAFAPIIFISFATDNFLRICGKEKFSMWLGIIFQTLNIILDIIFVVILKKGVAASAITSCVAMSINSLVALWAFCGKKLDLHFTNKNISIRTIFRIFENGSSEFFNNIATSIIAMIYNFYLLKLGGTLAVAAFSVIMYVDSIIGMMVFGICNSMQPAISYCYGAKQEKKAKSIFGCVIICSIILSILSMFFMLLGGKHIAPIFVKPQDTALLSLSIAGMKIFSFSYLSNWVDTCFSAYFTALEKPIRSFITSIFGTLIFPSLCLVIFTCAFGLNGIWFTPVVAGAVSAVFTIILALSMKNNSRMQKFKLL